MGCPIGEILEHEHWERWGFPGSASSASGRNIGQDPNIQPYQAFRFLQVLIAKEAAIQQLLAVLITCLHPRAPSLWNGPLQETSSLCG